jgi:hypothetical protein
MPRRERSTAGGVDLLDPMLVSPVFTARPARHGGGITPCDRARRSLDDLGRGVARTRLRWAILTLLLTNSWTSCAPPRDPIVVRDGMLILENQTTREWRNVRVTINDHFTAGTPVLLPGGLLTGALRDFQTGFGQRFDRSTMSVFKVRVSAVDPAGQPVALAWGK